VFDDRVDTDGDIEEEASDARKVPWLVQHRVSSGWRGRLLPARKGSEGRPGLEGVDWQAFFGEPMTLTGNSEQPGGGEVGFCYPRRTDLEARVVNGSCEGSFVASCEG